MKDFQKIVLTMAIVIVPNVKNIGSMLGAVSKIMSKYESSLIIEAKNYDSKKQLAQRFGLQTNDITEVNQLLNNTQKTPKKTFRRL